VFIVLNSGLTSGLDIFTAGELMFTISDVVRDICVDDMPNDEMREIFELVGPDAMVKLIECWGGLQVYLPKDGLIKWKKRKILAEYNGRNTRELARRYSVSVSWVYSIIDANRAIVHQERLPL
jgi:Mor family transcriptional regulator